MRDIDIEPLGQHFRLATVFSGSCAGGKNLVVTSLVHGTIASLAFVALLV